MSDTSQGPGWWLPPMGKWYPPQTAAPSPVPPPPQAAAPSPSPSPHRCHHRRPRRHHPGPGTPGLRARDGRAAIGIEWGHERPRHRRARARHPLAVRVGSVSRSCSASSPSTRSERSGQGGRGLAIAGIVLGIIGILASVVTLILVRAGVEEIVDNQPDEFDDVEILDCRRGLDGRGVAELEDHERQLEAVQLLHHRRVPGRRERRRSRLRRSIPRPASSRVRRDASPPPRPIGIEAERLECRVAFVERRRHRLTCGDAG